MSLLIALMFFLMTAKKFLADLDVTQANIIKNKVLLDRSYKICDLLITQLETYERLENINEFGDFTEILAELETYTNYQN